jgi:beta-lactamase regulating signal transducer with metallopeptidase domain/peptidoglycan/xylan/chitin deacetylase (PgdA/CDA1 family)
MITQPQLIENLGWTLVHSVWQFALVAAGLWVVLRLIRVGAANERYVVSVCALALAVILPVGTYWQISRSADAGDLLAQIERPDESLGYGDGRGNEAVRPIERRLAASGQEATEDGGGWSLSWLRAFTVGRFPALFPIAVWLWLLGVAAFSLRLAGGVWQIRKLKTTGAEPVNDEWQKRFESLIERLGIRRTVEFVRSDILRTPIAVGVIKPMILVPASLFLQIDPRQLESIIAHELIHIRRYDPMVSLAQSVAETIYFYHPCVWWISRQIRREREFAADAAVVHVFADDRLVYAAALANLEEIRLLAKIQAPPMAAAADGGNLMNRIQRILQNKTEIRRASSAWSAGLALVLISAVLLAVFSYSPRSVVNAQKRETVRKIAIGFVSIPPVDRTANPPKDSDATARLLITKLQQYKVPAIGFVTGASISDGDKLFPVRANIVRLWRDAGLEVGIGNFKHVWFYNTPYDDYVAGVSKNEAVVNKILGEKNLKLRYFSYPYLNTGKSVEERDRFERWLGDQGLASVKYTVDNNEWMYSYVYDMARNDNDIHTMNEVRVAFVRYMDKMMDHYEAYSQEMFGRDVAQTMVLTPSRLVADSADDLLGMLQKRGYKFVTIDEAQGDEAYKTPETMIGEFGNSWFERWTVAQGRNLRDEPKVDATVEAIWKERKPGK